MNNKIPTSGSFTRRCPALVMVAYEILTLLNVYHYIVLSSRRLTGENYFGYEVYQTWINPLVRYPHVFFPIVERWFYTPIVGERLASAERYLLYSFWEIALLDLCLGALAWYFVSGFLVRRLTQRGRAVPSVVSVE